jgi:hypothetical protein
LSRNSRVPARPELPILRRRAFSQAPAKFEFAINLKTATTLGLSVSPTVIALADEVIE